jgi:HK97 family phage portal protein
MRWPWQQRHDRDLFQVGAIPIASTYAAVPVSPQTAMQHSAVWGCVDLIAGSISILPLAAYRDGEESPLPALPPILRAPSAGWSLPEFVYAALQSLLVRGNAYGLIVDRAGAGLLPAQVELLAPERVGIDVNGTVDYRVDGQLVDPASIWHVRAFTTPGNVVGLSPIAHARQAIGLGLGPRSTRPSCSATAPSSAVSSPPTRTSSPTGPRPSRNGGRPGTRAAAASPSSAMAPSSKWSNAPSTSSPSASADGS